MSTPDEDPNIPEDNKDFKKFDLPSIEEGELNDLPAQHQQIKVKTEKLLISIENEFPGGVELEDGEVFSEDSSSDGYNTPVCRFYLRNNCFWGSKCRFKHPGVQDTRKYDMFESDKPLPMPFSTYMPMPAGVDHSNMPLPPLDWMSYPPAAKENLEHSFNTSLQNLKIVMRKAGYKINSQTLRRTMHTPWVEFNDLDTDPYYSRRDEATVPTKERSSLRQRRSTPISRASAHKRINLDALGVSPVSTLSSSSTPDYTTTTDSNSSSLSASPVRRKILSSPRKRKLLLSPNFTSKRLRKSQTPTKNSANFLLKSSQRAARKARLGRSSSSSSSSELSSYESSTSESGSSCSEFKFKYSILNSNKRGKMYTDYKMHTQSLKERLMILEKKIAEKTLQLKKI